MLALRAAWGRARRWADPSPYHSGPGVWAGSLGAHLPAGARLQPFTAKPYRIGHIELTNPGVATLRSESDQTARDAEAADATLTGALDCDAGVLYGLRGGAGAVARRRPTGVRAARRRGIPARGNRGALGHRAGHIEIAAASRTDGATQAARALSKKEQNDERPLDGSTERVRGRGAGCRRPRGTRAAPAELRRLSRHARGVAARGDAGGQARRPASRGRPGARGRDPDRPLAGGSAGRGAARGTPP